MKRIFLFLIIGLNFSPLLFAQNSIQGRIQSEAQEALGFVNVLLFQAQEDTFVKGNVSDAQGKFRINIDEFGEYYLKFSMIGFEEKRSENFRLDQKGLSRSELNITLAESAELLSEIEVSARRPMLEQKIDRLVVNVQNSLTSPGSNALQILERSPGVEVDRIGQELSLRGKSGVLLILDGRTMRLDGNALLQLLESLGADQIEKIELISTPPANFDAEGDAGIIAISTREGSQDGFNANINLNTGYGVRPKWGTSGNIFWKKSKFQLQLDVSARQDFTQENTRIQRRQSMGDQDVFIDIDSQRPAEIGFYQGRLSLDWQIGARTRIGVLFASYLKTWRLDAQTRTQVQDQNFPEGQELLLQAQEINDWTHTLSNLNIQHTFRKGASLDFNLDYLSYDDENPSKYQEFIVEDNGSLSPSQTFESYKNTPIGFLVGKLDYSLDLKEGIKVQTGLKATRSHFENEVGLLEEKNGQIQVNELFTDIYFLDENITAAYLALDYQISPKLATKAGLRYEYYDSRLSSDQEGDLLTQEFGRWFPSLFFAYTFQEETQLQLSYNERITRPAFNVIAPAFFFFGYNTILGGNPRVRPTTSRKVALNFQHKGLTLGVEYTDRNLPIIYQPILLEEEGILIQRAENMSGSQVANLSLNFPVQFSPWWESRYTLNAYWQRLEPRYGEESFTFASYFFTAFSSQNFTLPKQWGLELSARYNSKINRGLGNISPRIQLNLGLQKTFKNQMKVGLNWSDLFNLGSFFEIDYQQAQIDLDYQWRYDLEGNVFTLSLSWPIGNRKVKKKANRSTASEEERDRVN